MPATVAASCVTIHPYPNFSHLLTYSERGEVCFSRCGVAKNRGLGTICVHTWSLSLYLLCMYWVHCIITPVCWSNNTPCSMWERIRERLKLIGTTRSIITFGVLAKSRRLSMRESSREYATSPCKNFVLLALIFFGDVTFSWSYTGESEERRMIERENRLLTHSFPGLCHMKV